MHHSPCVLVSLCSPIPCDMRSLRNAVEGSKHWEGEWPALEIVTAAVTHGNKTWKVSVYDLPSLWQWVRQSQMQDPSCSSCKDQPSVGGSSWHHLKAVETQDLARSCRQPDMNSFALHHPEELLWVWGSNFCRAYSFSAMCLHTQKHLRCQVL